MSLQPYRKPPPGSADKTQKPSAQYANLILKHLEPAVVDRLSLRPVVLEIRHVIEAPGETVQYIYFLEAGMGSMTVPFEDGSEVEVGMFGYESVVGVSALMGVRKSLNRIFMQIPGEGYTALLPTAQAEFDRGEQFHHLALRYVQAQLTQAAQSAACNAKHDLSQRLARWLLICADRANSTTFSMSQEFLGEMIGASRPTVSIAATAFREAGLIDYHRGRLNILDRHRLEQAACECYCVVRNHLDNYLEFDTGFVA